MNRYRASISSFLVLFLTALLGMGPQSKSASKDLPQKKRPSLGRGSLVSRMANYGKLPLAFEPNQGQTDPGVQYLARGNGYNLFITDREAVLVLKNQSANPRYKYPRKGSKGFGSKFHPPVFPQESSSAVIRMKLEGSNTGVLFDHQEKLAGSSNYFIGKDPSQWRRGIPQYGKIQTADIYPGVDLVYYGNQGMLEYDFVVKPGADPSAIRLKYEGIKSSRVNTQGDLELETNQGTLRFRSPSVYQETQGQKTPVNGRYQMGEDGRIGFKVEGYDRTKPLVIDPVLDYSTYWGGSVFDQGYAVALDSTGNAYFTGYTRSADFPTASPYQGALGVGSGGTAFQNAFVAKINPAGTAMLYSTYFGGSYYDQGNAIAVDPTGNIYIAGFTYAPDFPILNAVQPLFGASGTYTLYSTYNTFVTEFDPTGSSLIFSTYWGGSVADFADGLALDTSGDVYVTGFTQSPDYPTVNPIQGSLNGTQNAFTYKLAPSGASVLYSTYLGGNGSDGGDAIAVDPSGNSYIGGFTSSSNFPTASPLQAAIAGPQNGFITEINSAGNALVYSTYLGGSGNASSGDSVFGIAVDNGGNAYVTGLTASSNFPLQN